MEQCSVHETVFRTWNSIPYMEQYSVHGTLFHTRNSIPYTWNRILYIEQYSVHGRVFRTWNSIPYMGHYFVHKSVFRDWNSIPYVEQYSVQYLSILEILINKGVRAKKHVKSAKIPVLTKFRRFFGSNSFIYQYFLKMSTDLNSLLKTEENEVKNNFVKKHFFWA